MWQNISKVISGIASKTRDSALSLRKTMKPITQITQQNNDLESRLKHVQGEVKGVFISVDLQLKISEITHHHKLPIITQTLSHSSPKSRPPPSKPARTPCAWKTPS